MGRTNMGSIPKVYEYFGWLLAIPVRLTESGVDVSKRIHVHSREE